MSEIRDYRNVTNHVLDIPGLVPGVHLAPNEVIETDADFTGRDELEETTVGGGDVVHHASLPVDPEPVEPAEPAEPVAPAEQAAVVGEQGPEAVAPLEPGAPEPAAPEETNQ